MTNRIIKLTIGLVFYAVGIVFTINANMGLAPWDAFHMGLTFISGISFGIISILVGLIVLLFTYQLDEPIGMGTLANIFVIGLLIDLIFWLKLVPMGQSTFTGIIMLLVGMEMIAIGSYFYIGSGFGTGPRDGLMVALTRVTNRPVGLIRGLIEVSVLTAGWLLGAKIGLGTVIVGLGIGPIVQVTFRVLRFDVSIIHHDALLRKRKTPDALENE